MELVEKHGTGTKKWRQIAEELGTTKNSSKCGTSSAHIPHSFVGVGSHRKRRYDCVSQPNTGAGFWHRTSTRAAGAPKKKRSSCRAWTSTASLSGHSSLKLSPAGLVRTASANALTCPTHPLLRYSVPLPLHAPAKLEGLFVDPRGREEPEETGGEARIRGCRMLGPGTAYLRIRARLPYCSTLNPHLLCQISDDLAESKIRRAPRTALECQEQYTSPVHLLTPPLSCSAPDFAPPQLGSHAEARLQTAQIEESTSLCRPASNCTVPLRHTLQFL
jgi:hypothetical protein